ncbi:MAG: DUF3606 domain-containing protein [Pseudomonadota bacterium]
MGNQSERDAQDRWRINLDEDWEVRYWMEELGVSREKLAEIVKEVGTTVAAVRARSTGLK